MIQNRYLPNRALFFVAILVLATISGCSNKADPVSCPVCTNPLVDSAATIIVTTVSDGDTFGFFVGKDEFKVRVLDIDCFETRRGTRLTDQAAKAGITEDSALALGFQAKVLGDSLLTGKQVIITRDSIEPDFDVYGRLLRRVFMPGNVNYAQYVKARGLTVP